MTDQIVKTVRVTGDLDRDTTVITLNGQMFAMSHDTFNKLFVRMCERKAFIDALKKVVERSHPPSKSGSEGE